MTTLLVALGSLLVAPGLRADADAASIADGPGVQAADPLGQFRAVNGGFTPTKVATGPDGNLWVATSSGPIWRFSSAGAVVDAFGFDFQVTDLVAADGNMWVTSTERDAVGRITPAGVATWFTDPTIVDPAGIVLGPDGALWFANRGNASIGRITTAGAITNLASADLDEPADLAFGSDGNVWIANQREYPDNGSIVKMTTAGVTTTFSLDTLGSFGVTPWSIIAGPGDKLWFVAGFGGELSTITTSGTLGGTGAYGLLRDLVLGPDGNVWVADFGNWDPLSPPYDPGSVLRVTPSFTVDTYKTQGNGPVAIANGPDGNLWFVNGGKQYHFPPAAPGSLGRVTPTGTVSDVAPPHLAQPDGLTMGPDGNVWIADWAATSASSMTPEGVLTPHNIDIAAGWIARGPDGNLWTTGFVPQIPMSGSIVRTTPAGQSDLFTGTEADPLDIGPITAGPDGNLWMRPLTTAAIVRITPAGVRTSFTDPALVSPDAATSDIVAGPDGNVWFTNGTSIGRITPAGAVTSFEPATDDIAPSQLAFDTAGNLWFTDAAHHRIGRRSIVGDFTLFPTDARIKVPQDLVVAPDGTVWFANAATDNPQPGTGGGNVGRLTPGGTLTIYTSPLVKGPTGIIVGPDDDLWVTDASLGSVVRVGWAGASPPNPPTAVSASSLGKTAVVSWLPPASAGSSPITSYTVTASPGGKTCTWTTGPTSCSIAGLLIGGSYTFTVTAASDNGPSAPSAPSAPSVPRFVDVPAGAPFDADITWLANEGIANGSPDGTFRPANPVDRQAMAAFLYRASGSPNGPAPTCASKPFSDVAIDAPFCGEIAWMKTSGVTTGFADGTFRPSAAVTREAMAAYLYRFGHGSPAAAPACTAKPFTDVELSHPFCGEIAWMKSTGLSTGYGDGTYRPRDPIARQAMAAFLHRLNQLP